MSAEDNKQAIKLYNQGEYLKAYDIWEEEMRTDKPQAYTNIGLLYLKGEGLERNLEKAKEYFEKGIALNSNSSYFNLATMYQNGIGVELDEEKSIEYFKKAAALNHEGACFRLALTFLKNKTDKDKVKEGFTYMIQAAKYNYLMAKIQLKGYLLPNSKDISNTTFYAKPYEEQLNAIEESLTKFVRPILKGDGGDIMLVDLLNENNLEIRLIYTGNCEGCSLASTTTYDLIKKTLNNLIDDSIRVYII